MTNGKVESTVRVQADHKVQVEAGPHRRSGTVDHVVVGDILKFARELEEASADEWEQVRVTLVERDGYLVKSMGVYWKTDEIDGKPAPQAMKEVS